MPKYALIGSAPSSVTRAPYDDPSWTIVGCSPGAYPHCRRADVYFEIHSRTLDPSVFSAEYIKFLSNVETVYLLHPWQELPNGKVFPFDDYLRKYGPYWFSSSLSWMFAYAIEQGATEIGLWGVDMASQEEYIAQRHACQWWIQKAQSLGINVVLPIESDLNRPFPLYGLCEADPMYVKIMHRKSELVARYNEAAQNRDKAERERIAADREMAFYEGAVDDINYQIKVWTADRMMQRHVGHVEAGITFHSPTFPPRPDSVEEKKALLAETDKAFRKGGRKVRA